MKKNHRYIIADHIKAICFLISDGVRPMGKQQGYILRRLMRRMFSSSLSLGIDILNKKFYVDLVKSVVSVYEEVYVDLKNDQGLMVDLLMVEAVKYSKAIERGNKEWSKIFEGVQDIDYAKNIFDLYQTHGVPLELSYDILKKHGVGVDVENVEKMIQEHQKNSKDNSGKQFKSGLAEDNNKTIRLHTATHLLHQSLREMFGEDIKQKGSAITSEKARFDFSFERRLLEDEIVELTEKVQAKINTNYKVTKKEMSEQEARNLGAIGLFGEKYGDSVTVYSIGEDEGEVLSREFCGGPHVKNTSQIGYFKIIKQKSVGSGVKRLEFDVV
ncbi:hypothetical protein HC766_08135 [Candidatus Gracilibacteria bacterium]|nr:hypothetical protein [Candidatus Gracilibacteria bacterium]NJS42161.1 hypothetical protein [Candidatus Gracilibacteria bacterium]